MEVREIKGVIKIYEVPGDQQQLEAITIPCPEEGEGEDCITRTQKEL